MATSKTIVKSTHQEAVVKVAGTAAAETIVLATNILTQLTAVGTISSSSTAITGVGTSFLSNIGAGTSGAGTAIFTATGVYLGVVASVASNTALTLAAPSVVAVTAVPYKIAYAYLDGAVQTVNIVGLSWSGAATGVISISRNSVVVATLQTNTPGTLDFSGNVMPPDVIENTKDIVVTISGAQAECWLKLRKVSGYAMPVENATYGSYDNPSVMGS